MVKTIPAAKNWLHNPSGELTALSSIGTVVVTRDNAHRWVGDWATKMVVTAGQTDGPGVYHETTTNLNATIGGGAHDFIARVRIWAAVAVAVQRVYLEIRYTGGTTDTTPAVSVTGNGDFQTITTPGITSDPAKTIDSVRLYVRQLNPSAAATAWVDGGDLRIDADMDSYVDGSMGVGYTWIGAAHNSASTRQLAQVGTYRGNGGVILIETKVHIRTRSNAFVRDVTDIVIAGEVDWDQNRDVKGTFRFTSNHPERFNEFADWIAPYMTITQANGASMTYQMGLYRVMPPEKTITPRGVVAVYECPDMTGYLGMLKTPDIYVVRKGRNPASEIVTILKNLGITRYNIPSTTRQLSRTIEWDPTTPWYQITNDLAAKFSTYALWADRTGQMKTIPYLDFDTMEPDFRYYTKEGSPTVIEPYTARPDLTTLANWIIVIKDDPQNPISVERKNENPKSKTSISNIGIIQRTVNDSQLEDLDAVNELARRLQQEWGSVLVNGSLLTLLEPQHDGHEVYALDLRSADGDEIEEASGRFWCSGWKIGFSKSDARMTHNIWRSVLFGDEV